jgi:hypothetical protein
MTMLKRRLQQKSEDSLEIVDHVIEILANIDRLSNIHRNAINSK